VFSNRDFQKAYGTNYEKGNMGSEQRFLASVAEITPPVSEPAALRNVMLKADNRSGLLEPQTYGNVTLQARTGRDALSVPLVAMIDSNHTRVYVAKEDNTIEERTVKTGANDGQFIEVLEGIKEGDVVVTSGMEGLKNGMRATVKVQGGGTK
jgi:multidrug efflux pump subunit AcrA (membrane-fusion protein)